MVYKWIATVSFLIAAALLSSNIDESRIGFVIFLYGHTLLAFHFWFKERDYPMFTNNVMFLGVDMYGIWRWFF